MSQVVVDRKPLADSGTLENAVREVLVNGKRPGVVSIELQVPYSALSGAMKRLGPTMFPSEWANYKPQRGRPRKNA